MSSRVIRLVLLQSLAFLAFSCAEPNWEESFIRSDEISFDGRYHFDVDFTDSTSLYDVTFYTKLESRLEQPSFPISVRWTAPSGLSFDEKVHWCTDSVKVLYRKDIIPPEAGVWDLSVYTEKLPGMLGLGLITVKHNGAR